MHLDVQKGRITLSGSKEQLAVVWPGNEGWNQAEFRLNGDIARLSNIGISQHHSEKKLQKGDPSLSDIPREFRLILKGAGYELREPGEVR